MRPLAAIVAACLLGSLAAAAPLSPSTAEASPKNVSAKGLLARLSVKSEDHSKRYNRALFGYNTVDADGDGCSTRKEVLIRDAIKVSRVSPSCAVYGKWKSPYDGKVTTNANSLEIDHLVPLAEAWYSGARKWDSKKKVAFGNDLGYEWNLQAVTKKQNQLKGAGDPTDWMPKKDRCGYAAAWIGVKSRWNLSVDPAEKRTLAGYLNKCDSPKVLRPSVPNISALSRDRLEVASAPTAVEEPELVAAPTPAASAAPVVASAPTVAPAPAPAPAVVTTAPAPAPAVTTAPAPVVTTVPAPVVPPVSVPTPAPLPTSAPVSTFTCPTGTLYGEMLSLTPRPVEPYSSYTYYDASGYVRNDSSASVDIFQVAPYVIFYTAQGNRVDSRYAEWDISDLSFDTDGDYVLPPGATATWHINGGLDLTTNWNSYGIATASPVSPFNANWSSDAQFYKCGSPLQKTNLRYTITH